MKKIFIIAIMTLHLYLGIKMLVFYEGIFCFTDVLVVFFTKAYSLICFAIVYVLIKSIINRK